MNYRKVMTCAMVMTMAAGCASGTTSAASSQAGTPGATPVTIAIENDMNTMDSSIATDGSSLSLIAFCQSGLVQYGTDGKITGDLAESWETSEDGMTWTFHLREGIKWSDGTPITAADFVYGFQRLVDPATASEYNYLATAINIKNAAECISGEKPLSELGVEAADDSTFIVHMSAPCSFMISLMSFPEFYPLNEAYVTSQGDQYALSPENMIYSGIYTMTDWQQGNKYTFTHNENYWDEASYPQQQIDVKFTQEIQTTVLEYQQGNVDYVTLSGEMVNAYKDDPGFTNIQAASVYYLCPNMNDEYMSNINLRKAISYSIDRDSIVNDVLKTGASDIDGLVGRGVVTTTDGTDFRDMAEGMPSYDPEKAASYYAEAVKEMGKDAVIDIVYDNANDTSKMAENIQQMITTACPGITVTLNPNPKKTRIQIMFAHDFSIGLTRWGPDYADPQSYLDLFVSDSSMNFGQYSSDVFDTLEIKATKGEDVNNYDQRIKDMVEAEHILVAEDYGMMPVCQEGGAVLISTDVEGYIPLVIGTGAWRHLTKTH